MNDRVIVKLGQTHECGQAIEQIFHVDKAEFAVTSEYPPLPKSSPQDGKFSIPESPKSSVTFEGEYTGMDINGIEFRDYRMVCMKCGKDVLFPDRDKATLELSKEQTG